MTDNKDEDFINKLEPEVRDRATRVYVRYQGETLTLASCAISLKRIADALDAIHKYGITTQEWSP